MGLVFVVLLSCLVGLSRTIPIRGNHPWTVVLCKWRDFPDEPKPRSYFVDWITNSRVDDSIANYFRRVSNGIYTIDGSEVTDWLTLPYSKASVQFLAQQDVKLVTKFSDPDHRVFQKIKQVCKEEAERQGIRVFPQQITVINEENAAIFCSGSGVLVSPKFFLSSALSHEMTHSFHIGHSFSDRPVKVYSYADIGEYDDKYDLMSTANAFMFPTPFGFTGPGLNSPHLDYLGWFPANRMFLFGSDGNVNTNIRLSSLSLPHSWTKDWLIIMVPYDRNDPQNLITLEFRTRTGFDRAIERDAVIIHKTVRQADGFYFSYLQSRNSTSFDWLEGQEWIDSTNQLISVKILQLDGSSGVATLHISSTFDPLICSPFQKFRRSFPGDNVCVTVGEFDESERINADVRRRMSESGNCPLGTVPRSAFTSDTLCLTKEERLRQEKQNQKSLSYANFFKAATFGMNACRSGFVWRQLDFYDYTCIPTDNRAKYWAQNDGQTSTTVGGGNCAPGFVPRLAYPQDFICVTPEEQLNTLQDNRFSGKHLRHNNFFNGIDSVDI